MVLFTYTTRHGLLLFWATGTRFFVSTPTFLLLSALLLLLTLLPRLTPSRPSVTGLGPVPPVVVRVGRVTDSLGVKV